MHHIRNNINDEHVLMNTFRNIIILFLLLPLQASAQDFTQMNWDEMRIDSVLPTYAEMVPLESDPQGYAYSVHVLYPEWAPLTKAEQAVAERERERLADTLQIDAYVAYSRGQAMLDFSFVPVVFRNGRYEKLMSGKVVIKGVRTKTLTGTKTLTKTKTLTGTETLTKTKTGTLTGTKTGTWRKADERTTRWAENSVLAQGRWVRIKVTTDGLYRLPFSTLRSMGFTTPENIRVYGYGGHRQKEKIAPDTDWDDLEPVALLPTADGFVFHANGTVTWRNGIHVNNPYALEASYFVTEATTPAEAIGKVDATESDEWEEIDFQPSSHFQAYAVYDPDEWAWFQGGNQLYESYDYAQGNSRSYTLTLPTYTSRYHTASFFVDFTAAHEESTIVQTTINGVEMNSFEIQGLTDYSYATEKTRRFTNIDEPQQTTTVRFQTTSGHPAHLNYFELSYVGEMRIDATYPVIQFSRTLETDGEEFRIRYAQGQEPHLWRLGEPGKPAVELVGSKTTWDDGSLYYYVPVINDGAEHRYVVFDGNALSSLPVPTVGGAIANQNLHATDSLDMVIITPASGIFDSEAERLAEAHRQMDGLRVGVVRADQVYNEFSSGTPDATAYRRFLKMLYDRAEDKAADAPRYLLLFGDGAWDNRMITTAWRSYTPDNFLLCFESDNSVNDVNCYVMEDYFGLMDDGEGSVLTREKVDVGVGRFPVRSVAEARALVDKTIAYMRSENAGAWKNVVTFLGDDGDHNNHLQNTEDVAAVVERNYPELEVRKVMWDAYQRQISSTGNRFPDVERIVNQQIEEGALMINYTGHAAPYCLSHEQVLRIEDFAAMTSPRTPLWMTAACDVMPFDTQKDNIGETAILNDKASIVAFYGTTRTVYADKNRDLNRVFCEELFKADELGRPQRIGDAVRLSKARLAGNENYPQNKFHFVLLGDPALRFGSHGNRVVLDSINGHSVATLDDDFILHAGGKVRLSGHVEDADGEECSSFHGTLTARLYDSRRLITCLNNDRSADTLFTYRAYDKMLYNGTDSVSNGRFTVTCPIPMDISYSNAAGRVVFYALSNDLQTEANGHSEDFLLGGTEDGLSDTEGPQIAAYLGNDKFENGGTVGAQPFFVAQLEDESGINTAGTAVGHDLELIVDGNPATTYTLNDYFTGEFGNYQRGVVSFTLPSLSEGQHSLLFRAWDTLGNSSTSTLDFVVDPSLKPRLLELTTSNNPATTQTTFLLTYDRPGSTCDFTIEVYDYAGRLLWNHHESGSSERGVYAIPWNLTTGSGFPLWSGVYLYRARISCNGSSEATKAQKLIINRRQ